MTRLAHGATFRAQGIPSAVSHQARVARPQLAERFVLMDDDYFVIRPRRAAPVNEYLLWRDGLPLHPRKYVTLTCRSRCSVSWPKSRHWMAFQGGALQQEPIRSAPMWCEQMGTSRLQFRYDLTIAMDPLWAHHVMPFGCTSGTLRSLVSDCPAFVTTAFRPLFLCVNDDWPVSRLMQGDSNLLVLAELNLS